MVRNTNKHALVLCTKAQTLNSVKVWNNNDISPIILLLHYVHRFGSMCFQCYKTSKLKIL